MNRLILVIVGAGALAAAAAACSGGGNEQDRTSGADAKRKELACAARVAARGAGRNSGQLEGIAREVERLRGLEFRRLPQPVYLRQAELSRRIRAEFDRLVPAGEVEASERALVALAAIPESTDLMQLARRVVSTDTAGYYDPRTRSLVVLSDTRRHLDGFERLTLAHELVHALADQRLGLPARDEVEPPDGEEDRASAESALIEGDAMLMTEAYALASLPAAAPFLNSGWITGRLPYYIEASEAFPYVDGSAFVCALYRRGGWEAVDRAYRRPPTTTAQVLFPSRYFAGEQAEPVPAPGSPGRGWRRLDRTGVGAADLLFLFEAPGNRRSRALTTPRQRAEAWAGGEAAVWKRGARAHLTMTLAERRGSGLRLCDSMRAWARAARRSTGAIQCSGRIVRVSLPA